MLKKEGLRLGLEKVELNRVVSEIGLWGFLLGAFGENLFFS